MKDSPAKVSTLKGKPFSKAEDDSIFRAFDDAIKVWLTMLVIGS